MSRPLYFGSDTEDAIYYASRNPEHQQMLRAKYRHAVFALGYTPQEALSQAVSVTAAGALSPDNVPALPKETTLYDEDYYASPEHALLAMAEYSGLGYETLPAFRAAWIRGVDNPQDASPFYRACALAERLYDSIDADLLPKVRRIDL